MKPHKFEDYKDRYESINLERTDDGVLTITIHEPGHVDRPLEYGTHPPGWNYPFVEWSYCFYDVARDLDNEVVIITGAGDRFIGAKPTQLPGPNGVEIVPPQGGAKLVGKVPPGDANVWDQTLHNGYHIQMGLLSIEVPVIGAVNGPAQTHAELALQSDIVICSEHAVFQDQPHFEEGLFAPGDGVANVWPDLLGRNRGRYFLLTGQVLTAAEALKLGVVNEVLPHEELMPRAEALAQEILKRPRLIRRYSRMLMVQEMRKRMLDHISYGLALEGLSVVGRKVDDA